MSRTHRFSDDCVQQEREIRTLHWNYELIRSQVKTKVPIVLIVTGLESYQPETEDWWRVNERTISKLGMTFVGHACITTATMADPMFVQRRTQSYNAVCKLIEQCHPSNNHTGPSLLFRKTASNNHPKVAIIGQARAGKSSLVNLIAGENVAVKTMHKG
ncbi:uncharacterized protein F5891DRAFT_1186533 [Suillus fuscotomentosus]|uniref:G domain-containing protein n=1 Tax=Suillus fuscotomentosus TaxID=1912939 RepID=A0AAD4EAK1_9AGAM|nr:uncharacterized protein F5891DRAFT_1186533 [Suillus fuscotomentosus]KAG1902417.1 hypothetical protein F5891DRAFT_1186533 [Suillus fuscotomentosus]